MKTVNTSVELLGKFYSIRCPESEQKSLQEAAAYFNKKMLEIQKAGTAINLERIAIMAGLNIAYELMEHDQHKTSLVDKINRKINILQDKLDTSINKALQAELMYTVEEVP
jgi:cell division protein ZapA